MANEQQQDMTPRPVEEGFGQGQPPREPETTEIEIPQTLHIEHTPEEPPPAPERPLTPRETMMKQIAANMEVVRAKELGLAETYADEAREAAGLPPVPKPPAEVQSTEQPPEGDAAPPAVRSPAAVPAPPVAVQPPVGQKVKLKVNGIDIDVSQEDALRLAQKGLAADMRFQEAAQMRQQAPQSQPQSHEAAPAVSTQPKLDDTKLKELHRRIQYGSDDEGQAAIRELGTILVSQAQEGRQQQPTPDQIAIYAAQQAKYALDYQAALNTLGQKFPEVFADDGLAALAGQRAQQLIGAYSQAGVAKPLFEIWSEACQTTKDRYHKGGEAPAPVPTQSSIKQPLAAAPDKLARKRAAPQQPVAANRTLAPPPEAPRANGSDVVNRIRVSRGQPALN